MKRYPAYFNRFVIELTRADAESASHRGQCDGDVDALLRVDYVAKQLDSIAATDITAELKEYGAWNEDELSDELDNRQRILWIAAGNIKEELAEGRAS